MHEWALAEAVVHAIRGEMDRCGLKQVTGVRLKIGDLQMIDMEVFLAALEEVGHIYGVLLKREDVKIEREDCLFRCRLCGQSFSLFDSQGVGSNEVEYIHFLPEVAHVFVRCPFCHGRDFEFEKGRGIFLESIEGET
jgi:hydrogenase nickel incorporation protein HypA/HybF